jgi:hypothetical protein
MRTGLGVETEGAESTQILELRETLALEGIERVLTGRCLNGNHDVLLCL